MTQQITSNTTKINWSKSAQRAVFATIAFIMVLSASTTALAVGPGNAGNVKNTDLYALVESGQGQLAVEQLAALAKQTGGWAPAPGDTVQFDNTLARNVRGSVQIVDQPPFECLDARLAKFAQNCSADLVSNQQQVRLGRATFAVTLPDGSTTARDLDDSLSTLIEEAAHSWQEYLFETDGQGGNRTRETSYEDWLYWAPGWEYQAKRYILSLDGTLLHLTAEERSEFLGAICRADGYANPLDHHIAPYGPPAGWPNPDGWPTADPTPAEHAIFCMNS